MASQRADIDQWKIEAVRTYLQDQFTESRIDHFPRGNHTAVLFLVMERGSVAHQLLVTKKFLDRFTDTLSMRDALGSAEAVLRLRQAGQKTVELH